MRVTGEVSKGVSFIRLDSIHRLNKLEKAEYGLHIGRTQEYGLRFLTYSANRNLAEAKRDLDYHFDEALRTLLGLRGQRLCSGPATLLTISWHSRCGEYNPFSFAWMLRDATGAFLER